MLAWRMDVSSATRKQPITYYYRKSVLTSSLFSLLVCGFHQEPGFLTGVICPAVSNLVLPDAAGHSAPVRKNPSPRRITEAKRD